MDEVKDEMSRWELLRAAADILDEEAGDGWAFSAWWCRDVADGIEAKHRASAREAVIDNVAAHLAAASNLHRTVGEWRHEATALADAGLLVTEVPA